MKNAATRIIQGCIDRGDNNKPGHPANNRFNGGYRHWQVVGVFSTTRVLVFE
jgi:hypothetical protein